MIDPGPGGRWRRFAASGGLVAAILAWTWPIGLGGMMPVGGDATQFSLGLMAVLGRSIRRGRIPYWNALWGYGFPGVGESQMGVFYPPHWLLYGVAPVEAGYAASFVLHSLWGAAGAAWAARRFGGSRGGAALAGFAFGACGFFAIHRTHQWAYTVGSWMPWAWGLAWAALRGGPGAPRRPVSWLAAVLAIQVLPGHFQLAFITQVGVVLLSGWALAEKGPPRRSLAVLAAIAAAGALAAAQLAPTYRLARLAESRRDYEYLSGFAATPIHLVSYAAPALFHRSPFWRPVAWDTFHTSPEEYLGYIGLAPLFLAIGAVRRGWKADPAVRALAVLAAATLVLSLGPYVPGFSAYCSLPGFSFFRAPARWGLATALAGAILAGKGFDAWATWPRPGRALARFAAVAAAAPVVVVLGFELALASASGPAMPGVARALDRALRMVPWPDAPGLSALAAAARRPQEDLRVQSALARRGDPSPLATGRSLARERFLVYRDEGIETAIVLAGLLALAPWAGRPRVFALGLAAWTGADLVLLGRHRDFDLGPILPLASRSPVLAALAGVAPGGRSVDPARNMPMVAGVAPLAAYRTLDLPTMPGATRLASGPFWVEGAAPGVAEAARMAGVAARATDPFETAEVARRGAAIPGWTAPALVADPALAGWLYGSAWVAARGPAASRFAVMSPVEPPATAWLVDRAASPAGGGDEDGVRASIGRGTPLATRSDVPERIEVDANPSGAQTVLLSHRHDPLWAATWLSESGARTTLPVREAGVGWMGVDVPAGPGRLRLEYRPWDVWAGMAVSAAAWGVWLAAMIRKPRPTGAGAT